MPRKTYSYDPIDNVVYCPLKDGSADVWLHDNIEAEEIEPPADAESPEPGMRYTADEVYFKTRHTREYVEEHFDALWVEAEKAEQPITERLNEVEELLGTLIDLELAKEE